MIDIELYQLTVGSAMNRDLQKKHFDINHVKREDNNCTMLMAIKSVDGSYDFQKNYVP